MVVASLTLEGHITSVFQRGQTEHYSIAKRLCDGGVGSISPKKSVIKNTGIFKELWTTSSNVFIPRS